jgi:hypothetical protein
MKPGMGVITVKVSFFRNMAVFWWCGEATLCFGGGGDGGDTKGGELNNTLEDLIKSERGR